MKANFVLVSLVSLCCMLHMCTALFFSVKETKTASYPVNESCVRKGEEASCDFFVCFYRRFPCRHSDFALESYRACWARADNMDKLDEQGKTWARETGKCFAKFILDEMYRNTSLNCVQAAKMARAKYAECFAENNGCDLKLWTTNREALPHLFSFRGHSLVRMFHNLKRCGTLTAIRLMHWFRQHVIPLMPTAQ